MNIIQLRIEKALTLKRESSVYHQKKLRSRRRATYERGVVRLPDALRFRITDELKARLETLCQALHVERGLVIRDALEMYLGIAEIEMKEVPIIHTRVRRKA